MTVRIRPLIGAAGLAVILITSLSACDAGSSPAGEGAKTPTAGPSRTTATMVKVGSSSFGAILTDQDGRTLYAFTNDKGGASTCATDCIATWPAFTGTSTPNPGAGVTSALLRTTPRATGAIQATYNGWPLYYYVGDTAPGETNGQGMDNAWFAVSAKGSLVRTAR